MNSKSFHDSNDSNEPEKSKKELKASQVKKLVSILLWTSLVLSAAYSIVRIIITPYDAVPPETPRTQADYILMLVSCLAGMVVMGLPSMIEKRLKVIVPDGLTIAYFAFLYAGIFLGEVRNFFHLFPYWDILLHSFSGGLLAVLGIKLFSILNNCGRLEMHLSPALITLFGFCFAVTIGVVWEIYEFSADSILGMNMQKYMTVTGELLIGQDALRDTMVDLIVDVASALIVSVAGYFSVRKTQEEYHRERAAAYAAGEIDMPYEYCRPAQRSQTRDNSEK